MDKLIVMGHSFGGSTAVAAAISDNRVKACLAMDPWLIVTEDLKSWDVKQPM